MRGLLDGDSDNSSVRPLLEGDCDEAEGDW